MMKRIMLIFAMVFLVSIEVKAAHPARVVDDADLLSDFEETYLAELLDEKSQELNFDIVVVTTNDTDGKSTEAYADDFFDCNGYGMGENHDGALLLVNMWNREWYISTTGYGIKALSDSDLDYIGEETAYYLSYGEYSSAFETFAEMIEVELFHERDADSVDAGEIIVRLLIALVVGSVLAFIPVLVMKKKLDNVEMKREASDYVVRDSIVMTEQRDMFLYRNIQRRLKPKDNNSSTHHGSSGRSHGGRGGSF